MVVICREEDSQEEMFQAEGTACAKCQREDFTVCSGDSISFQVISHRLELACVYGSTHEGSNKADQLLRAGEKQEPNKYTDELKLFIRQYKCDSQTMRCLSEAPNGGPGTDIC